jgi:hypothetical protein
MDRCRYHPSPHVECLHLTSQNCGASVKSYEVRKEMKYELRKQVKSEVK